MIYVLYATLALLVGAMVIVLIRLQIGPSNLDRAVALDVLTAIIVGMLVVVMALTGRIDLLPLLVVLTSVGFISSTVIARFSQAEPISDRRILSREEAESTPEPDPSTMICWGRWSTPKLADVAPLIWNTPPEAIVNV